MTLSTTSPGDEREADTDFQKWEEAFWRKTGRYPFQHEVWQAARSTVQQVGAEWMPIETAPEGTLILCCNMKATELRHWAFVDWLSQGKFCGNRHNQATHWMPLPPAPSAQGDQQ